MDNEEKKVKTTTPKKKATPKKQTTKKQTKTSKSASKTNTTKKVTEKKKNTKPVKKEEKKVEVVKVTKEEAIKEQETLNIPASKKKEVSKELLEIRRKRHLIEAIIILVLVLIAAMLISNRTFLTTTYKNDNINISIPRFSYFVKDKDNKVKFVTLRKSKYLNDYYNEYLEGFVFYSCAEGEKTFYYNEKTFSLIKEIKVEKKFAIKTVEITYDTRSPEEVCGIK